MLMLPTMSNRWLMDRYEDIYQWQRNEGDKIGFSIPMEVLKDMLKKAWEISLELHRRGLIHKQGIHAKEYNDWAKRVHTQLKRRII